MQSLINHLSQLQELVLIRDEHRATGDGSHLARLNASIDALVERLPVEMKSLYLRLNKRDHLVMSPMYNGSCAICGVRLPISQVQSVRLCKAIQNCPSCARILYEEVDVPHWVGEKISRSDRPKSGISRFSAEALMLPNLDGKDKVTAITLLAKTMEAQHFVDNADLLVQAALEREAILSTAMDNGLAFPHVRGVEGGGLALALGVSRTGIRFGDDGCMANVICFMTVPTAVSAFYLRLMAGLTEAFLKQPNRDAMLAAETPEQLWKVLVKATRYTIK
jgi:mannitol/fructose-specific phosphotransferase system IIA component (Ntr-type)